MSDEHVQAVSAHFRRSRYVALSGGAMQGVMFVGAFDALCDGRPEVFRTWHGRVKGVAGTSAGALIGVMLVAGLPPSTMRDLVVQLRVNRFMDAIVEAKWSDVSKNRALVPVAKIRDVLRDYMRTVADDPDVTLGQWHARTRVRFVTVTCNVTTSRPEFWCHRTQPDMPVWAALYASMAVPGLFEPLQLRNCEFVDGGLMCNLPSHIFPARRTLAMAVCTTGSTFLQRSLAAAVGQWVKLMFDAAQNNAMRADLQRALRTVVLFDDGTTFGGQLGKFAFTSEPDVIDRAMARGRACMRAFLLRDVCVAALVSVARQTMRPSSIVASVPRAKRTEAAGLMTRVSATSNTSELCAGVSLDG